jgi:hypothetical protein
MTYYPASHEILCLQGATFNPIYVSKIDGTAVNYTGYSGKMQVRKYQNTDSDLIYTFSTALGNLSLTSAGYVAPTATAAVTTAFPIGNYFYDIELTAPDGTVTRHMQGVFTIDGQVTL